MSRTALEATYNQLEKLANEFLAELDGIPDDDLKHWKPAAEHAGGGEMNTFSGLSMHIVQAASWRIVHQVFGKEYPRDRESEFIAEPTRAEIDELVGGMLRRFADLIASGEEADLTSMPPTIREDSPNWSRMEYLIQVVGHTALHLGHVQIHKQLWLSERKATTA